MKTFCSIFLLLLPLGIAAQTNNQGTNEYGQLQQLEQQNPRTAILKSAARLFGTRDDLTTVITVLPKDTRVNVIDSDSTYYHVTVEDAEGYIFKRQAVIENNNPNVTEPVSQPQTTREEGAYPVNQNTISRFTYLENKYGTSLAARINSGKIWKGMNGEMVRDSWGNPLKINRVITSNTVKEEWAYRSTVLYLENNKLVNWGPAR
jgi:hypothetical protein